VMLTMDDGNDALFEAIKSGAVGYLLKTEDTEVFFQLLLALAAGEAPLSTGLAARILKELGECERPDGSARTRVRGLAASMVASTSRLKAMAALRAKTMHTRMPASS